MGLLLARSDSHDRRVALRTPTALRAKLFPDAVDCVIADFSRYGARIRLPEPKPIGDKVVLVVWSSGLAFEASVRWFAGGFMGVKFLHSRDLRRPVPDSLADIQSMWLKRRPRIHRRTLIKQAPIIQTRRRRSGRAGWPETSQG